MAFEPNKITREHVLKAVKRINEEKLQLIPSTKFDVIVDENPYPPKDILRFAHEEMNGENIWEITGGEPTNNYLKKLGFEVKPKKDPILELVQKYKSYISKTKMQDEVYKWEMVKNYKGRPDINAEDFTQELKSIKFQNLLYAMSIAVTNHLAKDKPEEYRKLFISLFDESSPLNDRVKNFNVDSLKLYRSLGETLGHHQDERSIATYLTLHNPFKYTFYKSTFYKEFCKLMGVEPAGKYEKYAHYLELVNQFIENYIVPDSELTDTVKSYIPQYYDGKNNLLLAQDILYTMFNKAEENSNYWIFQGNLKIYDVVSALNDNALKSWSVKVHKDSIQIGDQLILWVSGNKAGCYALAEVTSDVFEAKDDESEMRYYVDSRTNEISSRVSIKITHNLAANPILKEQIQGIKDLSSLKAGSQGTNFKATKLEFDTFMKLAEKNLTNRKYWLYAPGENANKWDEFYNQGEMAVGWDALGDLRKLGDKDQIVKEIQKVYNTESASFNNALANIEFRDIIQIGDIIIPKKGRQEYLGFGIVGSEYYYDNKALDYKSRRKVTWVKRGVWNAPNADIVLKTLTDITKYPDYVESLRKLIGIEMEEQKIIILNNQKPLNQILYGPPGTGKTFTLNNEYFSKYTSNETSLSADQHFINVVSECSWWQVIAIALMQEGKSKVSALSENKWIKQKAALSNSNTVRPTLWSQLQSHTIEQCSFVNVKAKQQPFIFNKTEDSFWEILPEEVKENAPELLELLESVENFKPRTDKKIERFVFTTFHQGYSYEDFIEGIKPVLEENDGQLQYQIEDGIFKRLCLKAESDPQNKYAIFIDEINRGNVSAIFGELITLIEADKRKGAANQLQVVLPYSKKQFSVPLNIDIYGTMNTADRSVEALDTALRRRFSFVEMLPDATKLKDKTIEGIDLALLLNTLNERIEVLVDRDHTIGHAFFMNLETVSDLRSAFANKIIPLLQEYFYGNYRKMEMVIGSAFFHITEANKVKFAVKADDFDADGTVYHIKNISDTDGMSDASFMEALTLLIQGA
jgi:frataxin-like iron-binding protein CyaY